MQAINRNKNSKIVSKLKLQVCNSASYLGLSNGIIN